MRGAFLFGIGASLLSLGAATVTTRDITTYKTGPWQSLQLSITKTDGVDPGLIFIPVRSDSSTEADGTAVTIYDNDGNLIYQGPQQPTMDFKVQKLFGEDVIIFWSGEVQAAGGYGYGTVHILDNTYKEIYTITLNNNLNFVTSDGKEKDSYIDVHEHYITSQNTIIVSAINVTQHDFTYAGGEIDQWMIDCQFYEIDIATNKILFSWSALDHEDQISLSRSRKPIQSIVARETPWDPYHMNSVTSTNGGYLVSLRFYWSAFYLNKDGTIRWELSGGNDGTGDFYGEDLSFSWQHHIRVHDETDQSLVLSLFNNANTLTQVDSETTGMVFKVNLITYQAFLMFNLTDPTDPVYSKTQGSFQIMGKTGSNMFIGYGSSSIIKEYNAKGAVLLSGQFGEPDDTESYRAFKFPWTATPFWDPAVYVDTSLDTPVVYMSWNGATDYDNWAIYSTPSPTDSYQVLLGSYSRTGFETYVSLDSVTAKYIKVVARKGTTVLRAAAAVEI
ncbi:hypothetical protein N7462_000016 [Penicillium macrosclerotiorum]|uniref:uncharacterized protein n=1 Tax=Penicillium macrosclerotiorum TaxID=303699 RepID=UPI00254778E4|nr:uncharacterized protein N7462_000016 [Penicillium macrosclerotiorum]KAJ5698011.1 hypothetical protein N7462_000016 [Penicillium macrosclerotiorum]